MANLIRLRARRKNRRTKSIIAWWRTDEGYALVCETHEFAIATQVYRDAQAWVSAPDDWCPGCHAL